MAWLAVLGLISIILVVAGCGIAVSRVRQHRYESEVRRSRAMAQIMKIAEKKNGEQGM
jgi:hypothetical protein